MSPIKQNVEIQVMNLYYQIPLSLSLTISLSLSCSLPPFLSETQLLAHHFLQVKQNECKEGLDKVFRHQSCGQSAKSKASQSLSFVNYPNPDFKMPLEKQTNKLLNIKGGFTKLTTKSLSLSPPVYLIVYISSLFINHSCSPASPPTHWQGQCTNIFFHF